MTDRGLKDIYTKTIINKKILLVEVVSFGCGRKLLLGRLLIPGKRMVTSIGGRRDDNLRLEIPIYRYLLGR